MIRNAITSALVLSLALGITGCEKPVDGTSNPPPDGDATADADGKGDKKDGKGKKDKGDKTDGGDGNGESAEKDPTQTVCPAETADYPAPFFADTVLIRLPKGVTEDNLIEMTPTFAQLSSGGVESVSCVEGLPGAMISWMAMTYFEDDTGKDMITVRDETLTTMGYAGQTIVEEKVDDKMRFLQTVLDVPPTDKKPDPARALVQMRAANGVMYVVVFETHPNAWNALKETFYTSAEKMSFLPAGG